MRETRLTVFYAQKRLKEQRSLDTIRSWITRGLLIRRPDGSTERVFLEAYREGYQYITTSEALQRFFERIG